jgi:hypothetical protein
MPAKTSASYTPIRGTGCSSNISMDLNACHGPLPAGRLMPDGSGVKPYRPRPLPFRMCTRIVSSSTDQGGGKRRAVIASLDARSAIAPLWPHRERQRRAQGQRSPQPKLIGSIGVVWVAGMLVRVPKLRAFQRLLPSAASQGKSHPLLGRRQDLKVPSNRLVGLCGRYGTLPAPWRYSPQSTAPYFVALLALHHVRLADEVRGNLSI